MKRKRKSVCVFKKKTKNIFLKLKLALFNNPCVKVVQLYENKLSSISKQKTIIR